MIGHLTSKNCSDTIVIISKMNVLKVSDIDVSNLTFSDVRPYGAVAKIVYVNHKNSPIVMQLPKMKTPYGLGVYDDGERCKYSLDLAFGSSATQVSEFKDLVEKVDERILDEGSKKSLEWFKKKSQSVEVTRALYTSPIKIATENGEPTDKYPPTFKMKVSNYDGKFKALCFNEKKEQLSDLADAISKGMMLRTIVKLTGVWIAGGKCGLTWELMQVQVPERIALTGFAFADDDEDIVADAVDDNKDEYVVDSDEDL